MLFRKTDKYYYEILKDLNRNGYQMTPKEKRKIHRELRKYGDGIAFRERYPDFPLWFSGITLLLLIVSSIMD